MEHEVNKYLKDQGTSITGQQLYRVVWSNEQFEYRKGTFREFTASGIFVREVTGTKLVPKYSYIHERWIFEKWAPGNLTSCEEIPSSAKGDYIPVYVFEDSNGKALEVNRRIIDFLLSFMRGQIRQDLIPSQEYLEERKSQLEQDEINNQPSFRTSGEVRNAIGYTKGLEKCIQ